jgi:hypothetical protein
LGPGGIGDQQRGKERERDTDEAKLHRSREEGLSSAPVIAGNAGTGRQVIGTTHEMRRRERVLAPT